MERRKDESEEDTSDGRQGHQAVTSSRRTKESVIFLRGFFLLVISCRLKEDCWPLTSVEEFSTQFFWAKTLQPRRITFSNCVFFFKINISSHCDWIAMGVWSSYRLQPTIRQISVTSSASGQSANGCSCSHHRNGNSTFTAAVFNRRGVMGKSIWRVSTGVGGSQWKDHLRGISILAWGLEPERSCWKEGTLTTGHGGRVHAALTLLHLLSLLVVSFSELSDATPSGWHLSSWHFILHQGRRRRRSHIFFPRSSSFQLCHCNN